MSSNDPFLTAQADILSLLSQSRGLLQSYLRIRSSATSASQPELLEAKEELESTLTDLSADLQDLVESVRAVERDPYSYGLDVEEVGRRRKLVSDVGSEVEGMREQMQAGVREADRKRSQSLTHPDAFDDEDPLAGDTDGDGYGEWEEQRQMEMMHEQDEALDGVFQTVGNLRQQADTMGRELEEQAEMLEDTENITDRVGGKLTKGLKGIRTVVERNEGSHPLLQQTPLTVNPFIDLPKPPTLPPNYTSLPSTLPPSLLSTPPSANNPDKPAYVTTSSGAFAAHPSTVLQQNLGLRERFEAEKADGKKKVEEWERGIEERELQERRRKAPGWLDRSEKILEPSKASTGKVEKKEDVGNLMDSQDEVTGSSVVDAVDTKKYRDVDRLGEAMDRAFG